EAAWPARVRRMSDGATPALSAARRESRNETERAAAGVMFPPDDPARGCDPVDPECRARSRGVPRRALEGAALLRRLLGTARRRARRGGRRGGRPGVAAPLRG